MYTRRKPIQGFTLIEILVVIGMIAVLASIVLIAINPLRQFALARNAQRESDVNAILNAMGERLAENKGVFTDSVICTQLLPSGAPIVIGTSGNELDLRKCLVPAYISEIPMDPATGRNTCVSPGCNTNAQESYDTSYTFVQDPATSRITICAPGSAESAIPGSQPYCLTR